MKKHMALAAKAAKVSGACSAAKKSNKRGVADDALPAETIRHLAWIATHVPNRTGLNEQDGEDLRQDGALAAIRARINYKNGGEASLATYLNRSADLGVRMSLRARRAKKFANIELTLDLPAAVDQTTGAKSDETRSEYVPDETSAGFAETDRMMDVATVLRRLDATQKKVCELFLSGRTKQEIPALLGITNYEFKYKVMPKLARAFKQVYES